MSIPDGICVWLLSLESQGNKGSTGHLRKRRVPQDAYHGFVGPCHPYLTQRQYSFKPTRSMTFHQSRNSLEKPASVVSRNILTSKASRLRAKRPRDRVSIPALARNLSLL